MNFHQTDVCLVSKQSTVGAAKSSQTPTGKQEEEHGRKGVIHPKPFLSKPQITTVLHTSLFLKATFGQLSNKQQLKLQEKSPRPKLHQKYFFAISGSLKFFFSLFLYYWEPLYRGRRKHAFTALFSSV